MTEDRQGHEDEGDEATPERAEELLKDPARFLGMIRKRPEILDDLASGYRAAREGFSEFLIATDRGAARVKDTADKIIDSIQSDLDREGLSPDDRYRLIEAEERLLDKVKGNEKEVRQANERSFAKMAALGVTVAVGVAALGYLAKEGKLPSIDAPSA